MPVDFPSNAINQTQVFAQVLSKIVKSSSLLEIGCGTGIISICVALNSSKPENVLATDINPRAVENTKLNFESYGLPSKVLQSDLFDQLSDLDKFDFIFWNHPFSDLDVSNFISDQAIASGGFDYNYNTLERYFKDASKHLNPNGRLLLGTNLDVGNWGKILELSQKYDWGNYKILHSQAILSYADNNISTTLAIVEFCR